MYCKVLQKECSMDSLLYCKEHCFFNYRRELMSELSSLAARNKQLKEQTKALKEELSKIKIIAYDKYGMTSTDLIKGLII